MKGGTMRKEYVPPKADVLLLAPCEDLAAIENRFGFGKQWHNGFFGAPGASGFAITDKFTSYTDDDAFVIKTK